MPPLKDVLVKQAGVLGNLEGSLPAGAPRISYLMAEVASGLLVNPILPELPVALGSMPQGPKRVTEVIRGIEEPILVKSLSSSELELGEIWQPPVQVGQVSELLEKEILS